MMALNEYGKIAEQQWQWLGEQYPYIVLHEFVVMPNHIHGIIEINRGIVGTCRNVRSGRDLSLRFNGNGRFTTILFVMKDHTKQLQITF